MSKPTAVGLLEKFLRTEHRFGKSVEDITDQMKSVIFWFMDNEFEEEVDTRVEKVVAQQVKNIAGIGIGRYVRRLLSETSEENPVDDH